MINKVDILTQDSASVKNINDDGTIHRKAYVNSIRGRNEVIEELPIDVQNEIFYIWGSVATVEEIETTDNTPQPPTEQERISALEEALLLLMMEG